MGSIARDRKQVEVAHYEEQARRWLRDRDGGKWETDTHRLRHAAFSSYRCFEGWIGEHCAGKRVLDYGCGNGIHSLAPLLAGAREVVGIDLSEESLAIARRRVEMRGAEDRVSFLKMDCESLDFPDRCFDVAIDGGTFSSLDLARALPELARVLRPEGRVIGIETLGHNPLFNLKRRLNVVRGTRTRWAADHIFRVEDLRRAGGSFGEVEARFFHLSALFAIPFRGLPGGPLVVRALDRLDARLLSVPALRKHAFKTVFVLSRPIPPRPPGGGSSRSVKG